MNITNHEFYRCRERGVNKPALQIMEATKLTAIRKLQAAAEKK